ncbi:MAG: 30S ribosomal protein S20 [Candidatus Riflebacteria bacterium HGW-Riflebacteria-1]|jgi:small subunit ribosomal protein S20|nr:MAG: 30S ribosomal protein S20 [Candidatus Riflebacteria bacterium HGW-Riflebacteria-1]
MANTKSAAKNARKAVRRHTLRVSVKSELKTLRKRALTAAETKQPAAEVKDLTKVAIKKFAKAASNKYIHPKTAARKISRLMKAVNRLQA